MTFSHRYCICVTGYFQAMILLLSFFLSWFTQNENVDSRIIEAESHLSSSLDSAEIVIAQLDTKDLSGYELTRFHYIKADIEYKRKNHFNALTEYLKSLDYAKKSENTELEGVMYMNIGRVFYNYGSHELSLQFYKNALSVATDPERIAKNQYGIGLNYKALEKYDSALLHYTEALDFTSSESLKYIIIKAAGHVFSLKGEYDIAQNYFDRSLLINSEDGNIYHSIGLNYMYQGNTEKASLNFQRCIDIKPHFNTYVKYGEMTQDISILSKAVEIYPDQRLRYRNIEVFYHMGKLTDDMKYFDRYVEEMNAFHAEREAAVDLIKQKLAGLVLDSHQSKVKYAEEKRRLWMFLKYGSIAAVLLTFSFLYGQKRLIGWRVKRIFERNFSEVK